MRVWVDGITALALWAYVVVLLNPKGDGTLKGPLLNSGRGESHSQTTRPYNVLRGERGLMAKGIHEQNNPAGRA